MSSNVNSNELKTIAQRLREYIGNPHHIDPMSDAFRQLIGEAATALSAAASQAPAYAVPCRKYPSRFAETVPACLNTCNCMPAYSSDPPMIHDYAKASGFSDESRKTNLNYTDWSSVPQPQKD
jgi:hypothetical protein